MNEFSAQIQTINDLIKRGDWCQKEFYDLVQNGIDNATIISVNTGIEAGSKIMLASEACAGNFMTPALQTASAVASGAVYFSAAVLVGYSAYKVSQLYVREQNYIEKVSKEADWALNNLVMYCLKNESCPEKNANDVFKLGTELQGYRDHESFLAWINLEYERIYGQGDKKSLKKQMKYKRIIEDHIRPEAIKSGEFEEEMKIFCAANKILADYSFKKIKSHRLQEPSIELAGEFKNSAPNRNSPFFSVKSWRDWFNSGGTKEKQKSIEKSIETLLKPGYKFHKLKNKFYNAYKAKKYADFHQMKIIEQNNEDGTKTIYKIDDYVYSEYHKELAIALGLENKKESDLSELDHLKIRQFKKLFYQYRYEGGECEFNAHDFFKIKLLHEFYKHLIESKGDLIDFQKQFERQTWNAIKSGGLTIAIGCAGGCLSVLLNSEWISYTQKVHNLKMEECNKIFEEIKNSGNIDPENVKNLLGLKQQVELGVPGALEKFQFVQNNLKQFPVMYSDCSSVAGEEAFCVNEIFKNNLAPNDMVREAFENLPVNEVRNHLFDYLGRNDLNIPGIKEHVELMLSGIEEVGKVRMV